MSCARTSNVVGHGLGVPNPWHPDPPPVVPLRLRPIPPALPEHPPHSTLPRTAAKPSALLDTRVVHCGDNLEQLAALPDACVDLVYTDPPFNSNRNYEVFWGETKERRAFEDRHASTQAYIDSMRPRCAELARVIKPTGNFYCHCDWHASRTELRRWPCRKIRMLSDSTGLPFSGGRTPDCSPSNFNATTHRSISPGTPSSAFRNLSSWMPRRSADALGRWRRSAGVRRTISTGSDHK